MVDSTIDQILEVMIPATGEWIILHTWDCDQAEYDARGWLDNWGSRIGNNTAPLPGGGYVDLTKFCAIREKIQ